MASLRDQVDAVLRDQEKFAKDEGCGVWVDGSLIASHLIIAHPYSVLPQIRRALKLVAVERGWKQGRGPDEYLFN